MDASTWDLPDHPIWVPGPVAVGSTERTKARDVDPALNAVGEVLRAERIALWKSLYLGKLEAEARAEKAEAEVARLRDRVETLQAFLDLVT